MRVLIEGLQHAAAMMRQAAFKTLLDIMSLIGTSL